MTERLRAHLGEAVGALACIALGVSVLLYVRGFPELPGGYPGPALFPGIIAGLFVVFGLVLVVQVIRGMSVPGETAGEPAPRRTAMTSAAAAILAVPAYLILAEFVGFTTAMGTVTTVLMLKLGVRPIVAFPIGAAVALVIMYVFAGFLLVPLPRNPLGW